MFYLRLLIGGFLFCFGSFAAQTGFNRLLKLSRTKRSSAIAEDLSRKLLRYKRQKLTSTCPLACSCKIQGNDNKVVRCIGTSKTHIPDTLPIDATLIDFAYNNIRAIEYRPLSELSHITFIDFSFNKIQRIENNALKDQYKLKWLDLSNNPLGNLTLYDLAEARRSIKVLNVSNTQMTTFPRLTGDEVLLAQLEILVAARNNFTKLPVGSIPNTIKFLDISCLNMKELTGAPFQHVPLLTELVVQGCGGKAALESVQDGAFENADILRRIDFSRNALRAIPRGLPESLLYLDLSKNRISRLKNGACASDDDIRGYFQMISTDENERLDTGAVVGSDISRLVNLIELNLANNPITTLCSDDFMMMQQLKVLNLTNCKIKTFHPQTFLYAQSLRVLDLSDNLITDFIISELPDLQELYAQRNFISEIQGLTKKSLPSLREADFSYNRYDCDCHLREFLVFLGGSYNEEVRFHHLSATSKRYTCFKPPNLRDRSLMGLDIASEVTCGGGALPSIPWAAIGAPLSLFLLILVVFGLLMIKRRRMGKNMCCCSCCTCCSREDESEKKVDSTYTKYDGGSDIEIQNNVINDLAILSHEQNQKWVMNTFIPKLQHGYSEGKGQETKDTPLKIEVFTIGKTIRIDTLHRCIDVNRKIALIVTHEFLQEKSCRFILKVIQERLGSDPKETVLSIIMDLIAWKKMPHPLQKLLHEKTFLQFPIKNRERQEFYFWDNLMSLVFTSKVKSDRPWQGDDDETVTSVRHLQRYSEDEDPIQRGDTIRSSRRAKGGSDWSNKAKISTARAARLQRLGITSDGNVIDTGEIEEARHMKHDPQRPVTSEKNLSIQPSSFDQVPVPTLSRVVSLNKTTSTNPKTVDVIQRDIDDLYVTRNDLFKLGNVSRSNGRVHSLFPAYCEDAESIYSDDGEKPLPGHDIRPPERHRSENSNLRGSKRIRTKSNQTDGGSKETINVLENLHGTEVKKSRQSQIYPPLENADEEEFNGVEAEIETPEPKREEKREKKSKKRKFW